MMINNSPSVCYLLMSHRAVRSRSKVVRKLWIVLHCQHFVVDFEVGVGGKFAHYENLQHEQQNKIHEIVESSCGEHHGYVGRVCGMRHLERAGTGFGSVSNRLWLDVHTLY